MPELRRTTFTHAGRQFTIFVETHADPNYVVAEVFEDGRPAQINLPGGRRGSLNCGISVHLKRDAAGETIQDDAVGPEEDALIDALVAMAEANFRSVVPAGEEEH